MSKLRLCPTHALQPSFHTHKNLAFALSPLELTPTPPQVLDRAECYVSIELDMKRIAELQLNVTSAVARAAILAVPKLKVSDARPLFPRPPLLFSPPLTSSPSSHLLSPPLASSRLLSPPLASPSQDMEAMKLAEIKNGCAVMPHMLHTCTAHTHALSAHPALRTHWKPCSVRDAGAWP